MVAAQSRLGAVAAAAALLGVHATLSSGAAFLSQSRSSPPSTLQPAGLGISEVSARPAGANVVGNAARESANRGSSFTAAIAASLIAVVAASCRRQRRSAQVHGEAEVRLTALTPHSSSGCLAGSFVSAGLHEDASAKRSPIAMRSRQSMYNLYFKSKYDYQDRARRNMRNRAYNIFMKNKYKKCMKRVLTYASDLEFGDAAPASLEQVMSEIKDKLDEACTSVDETCVQGVLHRNTAARRKDRMCRAILRGCIAKGILEKPEDPFTPAYKVIGYEMPECYMTREPRPWQLPGWKSPWMLRREYKKWQKQKAAKAKAEA